MSAEDEIVSVNSLGPVLMNMRASRDVVLLIRQTLLPERKSPVGNAVNQTGIVHLAAHGGGRLNLEKPCKKPKCRQAKKLN